MRWSEFLWGRLQASMTVIRKGSSEILKFVDIKGPAWLSRLSYVRKESLDSLDDDMSTDASVQQQRLFQRAFGQIMERTEESFQVFRSVLQLTPTSVLLQDRMFPGHCYW